MGLCLKGQLYIFGVDKNLGENLNVCSKLLIFPKA